jgi:hypothetical protein
VKPHERRQAKAYPYYKLATWNARNQCWNDGKAAYPTDAEARAAAVKPGRYRVSEVTEHGRRDLPEFAR